MLTNLLIATGVSPSQLIAVTCSVLHCGVNLSPLLTLSMTMTTHSCLCQRTQGTRKQAMTMTYLLRVTLLLRDFGSNNRGGWSPFLGYEGKTSARSCFERLLGWLLATGPVCVFSVSGRARKQFHRSGCLT